MANTFGHTSRRYVGEKLYYATIAQRKAIMIADDGTEPADGGFWDEAMCECARCESCETRAMINIANMPEHAWHAHELHDACERAMIEAMSQPEPAITHMGHWICVEWETESGYRYWDTIDEGALDHAIWSGKLSGRLLSDIDEPANVGRPLGHGDEAPEFYAS